MEKEVKGSHKVGFYERYIKRPLDFTLSLIALIVLSPVLAIVACLVKIKLGSPILFKQQRAGYREQPYGILKFRTMTNETDAEGHLFQYTHAFYTWAAYALVSRLDVPLR